VSSGDTFSVVLALLGTIGVIILTYYGSRWYATRFTRLNGSLTGAKHIKVVDRLIVGKSGSIIIIEVQGIQYMVGVSEQNIQILTQLDEPIPAAIKQEISKESFLSVFKSFSQKEK
jgi:flagellar protein FliO/FliZ